MAIAITKMSRNGQIVIPAEIRKDAGIKPATQFLVFNQDGNITLKKMTEQQLKEEIKFMASLERSERQIKNGEYTTVDADISFEEFDKLMME